MAIDTVVGAQQQAKAKLLVGALAADSVSGEVMAKTVRSATVARLRRVVSNQPVIRFEAVKPVMDEWCNAVAAQTAQYVKPGSATVWTRGVADAGVRDGRPLYALP